MFLRRGYEGTTSKQKTTRTARCGPCKDETLLEQRRAEGWLSDESFRAIQQIVAKAKSHDWQRAENELYEYRKATPFPK